MDKRIYIGTTGTVIVPYTKKQSMQLERLTHMKDFALKYKWNPISGFNMGGFFVTHHFPLFFWKNEFPDYEIVYREPITEGVIPYPIPFDINDSYEITAAQFGVIKGIIYDLNHFKWFVNCPQGFGKTFISIFAMHYFRVNTLIMCYSTDILQQWKEKIEEYTNFPMRRVITLDSGKLITMIIGGEFPIDEYSIFLATPGILTNYGEKHGYECIHQLFEKLKLGLKIYDEAHRNLGRITKIDALTSVAKTIYLSGDFAQASKYKTVFMRRMFENVPLLRPDDAIAFDMRYTIAAVVEYNSKPTDLDVINCMGKRGMDVWHYMEYQMNKGVLERVIYWILDKIVSMKEVNRRTLLLTSMIEHCDRLYDLISERYDSIIVGKYHGDNAPEDNKHTKEHAQIIVATYSSFSTGIDTTCIKYVISTSMSNRVEDSQASGRARPLADEENCIFWMLVDVGFEKLVKKEVERIDYLKQVKVKDVIKLTYTE